MVSVKPPYTQQHPHHENHRPRTRLGFGLFHRGNRNDSATSIMSPHSEHERLQQSDSLLDQRGEPDVDMPAVASPSASPMHASNGSNGAMQNDASVSSAHASNGGMMQNGIANGVGTKQQHADQMLPPPADNNFVHSNMDKAANRKLFNSILCCIRSARPDRLMLRGSSPIRNVSLSPGDGSAATAAGPLRNNSSENGFAGGNNNNAGGLRYMNGVSATAKHHNRMLSGYYRGPLSVNGSNSNNSSSIPLLPAPRSSDEHRKLLVIDLDETLVHSSFKPVPAADFIVPVEIDGVIHQVYVQKRPHVDEFLQKMGELYECVLFTASLAKYADPVADLLDKHGVFRARLFRESCVLYRGNYVKDLSRLGRELEKIIIVDNSPGSYSFHPENAVPVLSWFDDMSDRELLDLVPFLSTVSAEEASVTQTLKCINVLTGTDASGNQYVQSTVTRSMAAGDVEHGVTVRTTQERETTVQPSANNASRNGVRATDNNASNGENGIICSVQQSSCTATSPMQRMNGFAQQQPLRAKDMMSLLMSALPSKQVKQLVESSSPPSTTTTVPSLQNGTVGVKHISAHYHPSSPAQRAAAVMPTSSSDATTSSSAHRGSTSSATRPSRLLDQLSTAKQSFSSNADSVSSSAVSEMPNSPTSPSYSTELLFSPTSNTVADAKKQSSDQSMSMDNNNPSDVRKLGQSIRNEAITNLVGDKSSNAATFTSSLQPRFTMHSTTSVTTTSMLPPPSLKASATAVFRSPQTHTVQTVPKTKTGEPGVDEYGSDNRAVDGLISNLTSSNTTNKNSSFMQSQSKPVQFNTNSLRRRGELHSNSKDAEAAAPTQTEMTSRSSSTARTAVKPTSAASSGREEVIPFIDSSSSTPTHDKAALLTTAHTANSGRATQQQVAVANGVAGQAKAKLLAAAASSASSTSMKQPLIPQPVVSSHVKSVGSKHALAYRKSGNYDNIRNGSSGNAANGSTSAVLNNINTSSNSGIKAASHVLRSSQNAPNGNGGQGFGLSSSQQQHQTMDRNQPNGSLLKQPTKLANGSIRSTFNKTSTSAEQNGTANGRAVNNNNFSSSNFPHRTVVSLGPASR